MLITIVCYNSEINSECDLKGYILKCVIKY